MKIKKYNKLFEEISVWLFLVSSLFSKCHPFWYASSCLFRFPNSVSQYYYRIIKK